jgi:transcription antitermination factor NusG
MELAMAISPLETFLYPDKLLEAPLLEPGEERWWVLHTRPRAEKQVASRLHRHQSAFFLPLLCKRYENKSRKFESHLPMFPSYVFLHGTHDARLAALATNLVVQVLPVVDQQRLHSDLANVHRLIVSEAPLTAEHALTPGSPVEIIEGPFAGMQGKMLGNGSGCRLFIEVKFLQRGVSVAVEPWKVRSLRTAQTASC